MCIPKVDVEDHDDEDEAKEEKIKRKNIIQILVYFAVSLCRKMR